MTTILYTFGYTGRKPEEVKRLVKRLDAVVFDIRFSPRSRNPVWTRKRLTELLGADYVHVAELGNVNYQNGGPIKFLDLEGGLAKIKASPRAVILMCVCKDLATCHRAAVVPYLLDGCIVQEIEDIEVAMEGDADQQQLALL